MTREPSHHGPARRHGGRHHDAHGHRHRLDPHADPADPDPRTSTGLEPGGAVRSGETPPVESSTVDAGPRETHNPTRGWSKAPVAVLIVLTALFLVFFVAHAISLL
ncbi:hypothetical protein GCM10009716_42120 [Streptomyces sodiiphilus]|uniref:Uncharacterized protein n=1 Tax=Streptomyces sodiiphilus TaxID=226217 RepID=A0ABN2PSE8_9ACTN